ncbi:MAG TPA: hypothetical protein VGQ83_04590 [Polyangia bacterium]|jgi:preprotein translocase subunit SecD
MLRPTTLFTLLALGLCACGAATQAGAGASQPIGSSKVELRLIEPNEAAGLKVPTWDGKLFMFVGRLVYLTNADFKEVRLGRLPDGAPAINVQLDQTAALTLEDLTLKNRGRRLAVLVDGKIVTAPTIKEPIEGGKMSIVAASPADTQNIYTRITGK